jgi:2-keto-4-pentenoate hydratase/2-oxohepta-3-ene-1,7-dioic acid hydratase in catechol pathway
MKLVFYDDFKFGAVRGDEVIDLSNATSGITHTSPQDLLNQVIANYDQHKGKLEEAVKNGKGVPVNSVKLRSPLPKPYSIVCMAVNYMEDGTRDAPAPINAFHKSPHSVIGDGDTMILPDMPATIFEGEAELAIVIGKKASHVKAEDAYNYIFGYLNFIDGSARGVPAFFQMKSRHTFAPMGPWIVTADEVPNPQKLQVKLWVNGNLMQNFNSDDMAHKIPRVIEWVSSVQPLEPGDIVATGTNHRGLSAFQDGDKVELETEGLGRLHISVKDDLKRTWPRETRLDRQNQGFDTPVSQATGKYAPA